MSDAVSALSGAKSRGYVTVAEVGLQGMITLRGDLSSPKLAAAVKAAVGTAVPERGRIVTDGSKSCAWMSPDELLLVMPYADTGAALKTITATLNGTHHLAVVVSDARAMFKLTGKSVREVIAKLSPVDMAPGSFEPGQFRRSRLTQIPVAMWMSDAESVQIICFRSVAQYAFDLLKGAAAPGSEVRYF